VVAHPADDYVADFTKDVPRAHVLTARSIVQPIPAGNGFDYAGDVSADTVVQELIAGFASSDRPMRVVDGDQVVGMVDRGAVMAALVEER
jgi:glycine betaine/proline transport system ATP-binding protein